MSNTRNSLTSRRCHLCLEPIPLDAEVTDPGTKYGPDRPRYFCSDAHAHIWGGTYQAHWMKQAEAQRALGRTGIRLMQRAVDRIHAAIRGYRT